MFKGVKDRADAPFGGFISSFVANGINACGNIKFTIIPTQYRKT
tara:strand:- start:11825 stop:11956 length:132 start_codon:yes stop_codon:yes gene_type:complete